METQKGKISRRKFMKATGGITFAIAGYGLFSKFAFAKENEKSQEKQITAWVHLDTTGQITIFNPAAEMGQGSMTALAVLVAEEMDADWSKVNIDYSPIEPGIYGRSWGRGRSRGGTMLTVGSYTVSGYYDNLRHAGAQVRYVLLHNVSQKWDVPLDQLRTSSGFVIHDASNRKISYGEIATFATVPAQIPEIPEDQLKSPEDFQSIGKYLPRYDVPAKVDGSAQYSMDVKLPDMVYAVISRSPVHGSKPSILNENIIKEIPGIVDVVALKHGIGIVAESIELAIDTRKKLEIKWSSREKAETHNSSTAYADYEKIASDRNQRGNVIVDKGNVDDGLVSASKTYTYDYKNDYVYHAQMEPLNAVVSIAEDGASADVWVGTQGPAGARSAAANALGLKTSKVKLHCCYLGGGFGRRSMSDYVSEAALLAKAVKRPLKLIWTREDDLQYGAFRPMSLQRMQAGVDKRGNVIAWQHDVVGTGGRLLATGASTNYYSFPNQKIQVIGVDHGVRTKHWRAVGHGPNKFAIESFIDEIAADQKLDPVTFRKNLMKDFPRALKVLQTAADMADWDKKSSNGKAKGIAFGERSGSLVAGVCEISIDKVSSKIKVHRIWAALDAGIVVQPDNAVAQMEGAIIFGMSSILNESITFKNGIVQESNFHDYPLLRMADAPESIEVKIIESQEPPSGIGEAGLPWVGGAIANAFASLTGKRLQHLPFTPEKVREVLES
ncbi:molybdopterin-dependent oxidoreductase [Fulvivirgaceae bacterium BMA10]|uniref:Molybdopterin-dependent oxidoreductase n=1 Tax=Splendidivirga corallicola TaxID=3051826 RepID=A0ABT8KML7_9BACT|nr:molybdopterin-dependent oxidoreductase [Fulvivirgaceae bacterium BMA10]